MIQQRNSNMTQLNKRPFTVAVEVTSKKQSMFFSTTTKQKILLKLLVLRIRLANSIIVAVIFKDVRK